MKSTSFAVAVVAALAGLASACGDDHDHSHDHAKRSQPGATQSTSWPSAPLVWQSLNFIHTTDSHGWLIGHTKSTQPEPNYSGDFGDFASFVTHMKLQALERGVDLLLVDSGDLHDGTGLSDGFPQGGVDGHDSNKFITQLPYDVLAIGNHELYNYPITYDMYKNFAPKWDGKYLSSNVNITVTGKHGAAVSVPVGSRYRKFKTLLGKKVTAFGVLYNFSGNAANTTVQYVADMVKEPWFLEAIAEAPDFFLLAGHMPVSKDNWPAVFNAIRAVHPLTPIFIFGGHTHIRDCVQLDNRSMSIESGRYMETVGWMSVDLNKHNVNSAAPLKFTRRYLDPNRNTYKYHTGAAIFDTIQGVEITKGITQLSKEFNISYVFGTAPQDYYLSRVPYTSNSSVLNLFTTQVMPVALSIVNPSRTSVPSIAIANSGSQRFDLYSGPFTRNDQFIVSPFDDKFLYLTVPYSVGSQVLSVLNQEGASGRKRDDLLFDPPARRWLGGAQLETDEQYAHGIVDGRYNSWLKRQWEERDRTLIERSGASTPTLGYVTTDGCPGVGDDTVHTPIPYYDSPAYIASPLPTGLAPTDQMDVIFLDFFETQILSIVNGLQTAKTFTTSDVFSYGNAETNTVFGIFAQKAWN